MIRALKTYLARRRLSKLVAQTRKANAEYAKRRAAGKLGHARRRGLA